MEQNDLYFASQSVLVIEDDIYTLELMSELLEDYFVEVVTASSAKEGISKFKENNIDLVLSDIRMPDMSGIEVAKIIRDMDFKVPIVFISAFSDTEVLLEATNLNIQGYVLKPVNIEKLLELLGKVIDYTQGSSSKLIQLDKNIKIDLKNHKIINNQETIALAKKETRFLELLIKNNGYLVTYETIEDEVWFKYGESMSLSTLRTLVKKLRKKLPLDFIKNVSKSGYKIDI